MKPIFFKRVSLFLFGVFLILISYFYVDRQLVWFLVDIDSRQYKILKIMASDIITAITVCIFLFYIYFFIKLIIKKINSFDTKVIIVSNAVIISIFLKNIFKIIFARYWAATFICNNPSLLDNNAYGFNWLKTGSDYGSFPSGHSTFIVAFLTSIWFVFPKVKWLWVLIAFLVIFGQIAMYYHFISDVIAGIMLGSIVGYSTVFYSKSKK